MRLKPTLLAIVAASFLLPAVAAKAEQLPPECKRFSSKQETRPNDFAPRLARLCVRLIDAHTAPGGLSADEREAAMRLGNYLAIVGELDLRKGVLGFGQRGLPFAKPTNETARYLIADRIGLLDLANRLAPQPKASLQ